MKSKTKILDLKNLEQVEELTDLEMQTISGGVSGTSEFTFDSEFTVDNDSDTVIKPSNRARLNFETSFT